MITSKYENLYECAKAANIALKNVDAVVEILRKVAPTPLSPKAIGLLIFGPEYDKPIEEVKPLQMYHYNAKKASQRAHLGQITRHLHKAGFIKRAYLDGEPVQVEKSVWVTDPAQEYNEPRYIKVHDDKGNTYDMENPNWDWYKANLAKRCGHYENRLETVIPKIKAWVWVGG